MTTTPCVDGYGVLGGVLAGALGADADTDALAGEGDEEGGALASFPV